MVLLDWFGAGAGFEAGSGADTGYGAPYQGAWYVLGINTER